MPTVTGVTPEQKRKLEAQVNKRLASRADTRGSSKRRTGKDMANIRGGVKLMPSTLAGTTTPLTTAMKQHVKNYAQSDASKAKYAAGVKSAYKNTPTSVASTKIAPGQGFGSHRTGSKRKDVRPWSENIMSAYKKKYNIGTGTSTAADRSAYRDKQQKVSKRRKHLLGVQS
jgi:hypothetical protein|tara:strand:- start:978 stop:1490 length:513 start_codon:yes stop_codon:yes gene_type:complete